VRHDIRPEQLRADPRLGDHRAVRCPGGHDRNEPARRRHAAGNPRQPRPRVLLRVRRHPREGGARGVVGARDEHAPGAAIEQGARDCLDLLGRLALSEDGLRRSLSQLAVDVDAREPQVAERQLREPVGGVAGRDLAAADALEQGEDVRLQAGVCGGGGAGAKVHAGCGPSRTRTGGLHRLSTGKDRLPSGMYTQEAPGPCLRRTASTASCTVAAFLAQSISVSCALREEMNQTSFSAATLA
jgi:hypothetical protein